MLLHQCVDVRSSCDICDVTFQGCIVCAHGEETPHHHEAVAAAQTAQHADDAVGGVVPLLSSSSLR